MHRIGYIIITLLIAGCINPYTEFETIPDELDEPNLLLYFQDFASTDIIDKSGHSNYGFNESFQVNNNTDGNFGSFLNCSGNGKLVIDRVDLTEFQKLTFSFWFKGYVGGEKTFIIQGDNKLNGIRILNDRIFAGIGNQTSDYEFNLSLLDGNWNMFTITMDEVNIDSQIGYKAYINGQLVDSFESTNLVFSNNKHLELFQNLIGKIDNIRLYDIVIKEAKIMEIFNSEKNNFTVNQFTLLNKNLISYYTFDNETFEDKKNNYNGVSQSISYSENTQTSNGYCANFNQSSVEIDASLLGEINSFSISFWMKSNDVSYQSIVHQSSEGTKGQIFISDGDLFCGDTLYSFSQSVENLLLDDKWHMLTIAIRKLNQKTGTTGDIHLYIDGELKEKIYDSHVIFSSSQPLLIGYDGSNMQSYFNGYIDNMRLYNKLLSKDDVKAIYMEEL